MEIIDEFIRERAKHMLDVFYFDIAEYLDPDASADEEEYFFKEVDQILIEEIEKLSE